MAYQDLSSGERIEAWDFEKIDTLEGVLEAVNPIDIKDRKVNFYHIREKSTGELVGAWGSASLDRQMALVKHGEQVKIVRGKQKVKSPKTGFYFWDYKCSVDR